MPARGQSIFVPGPDANDSEKRRKSTTPIPSLKRDSPAIFVDKDKGALARLSMSTTAMGSVGEMIAPSSKQYNSGTVSPREWKISQASPVTSRVDRSVVPTARDAMRQRCSRNSSHSI